MNIDYSLVLFILTLACGLLWLFDVLALKQKRMTLFRDFAQRNEFSEQEFNSYKNHEADSAADISPHKKKIFQQADTYLKEPVAVEYGKSFFPILLAVLLFRSFLFEPFQIPTGSMIPSLNIGDYIVVNKYAYGLRLPVTGTKIMDLGKPKRGDVMVFVPPHDPNYFVKRVIGLPGDEVRYDPYEKRLYINGEEIQNEFVGFIEDRSPQVNHFKETLGEVEHDIYHQLGYRLPRGDDWMQLQSRIIPEGHYFMMGDNRDNSQDSRSWGLASEENIVGKAVAVWMHKEPGMSWPTFSQNRIINP